MVEGVLDPAADRLDELEELVRLPLGLADDEDVREDLVVALVQLVEEHVDSMRAVGSGRSSIRPGPGGDPGSRGGEWRSRVDRGRARRFGLPRRRRADDPRGWRLGGGVTYAALTTARLGLRTAAVIGVDAPAARRAELDLLRDAGRGPDARAAGRGPGLRERRDAVRTRPDLSSRSASRCRSRPCRGSWRDGAGLVARAGRRRDRRGLGGGHPARRPTWPSAGRGCCATSPPARRVARRAPSPSALLRRADLVGVSHHDVGPGTDLARLAAFLHAGRRPARHRGARRRAARPRSGPTGPDERPALPADRDRPRDRPDRRRRHVPRGPARLGPAAGDRRARSVAPRARPALRGRRRLARGRGSGTVRRPGPGAVVVRRARERVRRAVCPSAVTQVGAPDGRDRG